MDSCLELFKTTGKWPTNKELKELYGEDQGMLLRDVDSFKKRRLM